VRIIEVLGVLDQRQNLFQR